MHILLFALLLVGIEAHIYNGPRYIDLGVTRILAPRYYGRRYYGHGRTTFLGGVSAARFSGGYGPFSLMSATGGGSVTSPSTGIYSRTEYGSLTPTMSSYYYRTFGPDGSGPMTPSSDPTGPGDDPTGPGDYPTGPGDYPTGPGDYPTGPGGYPTGPGDYPTGPGGYPTGPGDYPTGPGGDPMAPGGGPTGPGGPYSVYSETGYTSRYLPVGSGMPGSGMPGNDVPGRDMPGSGMPGSGMPGSGMSGSGMPGGYFSTSYFNYPEMPGPVGSGGSIPSGGSGMPSGGGGMPSGGGGMVSPYFENYPRVGMDAGSSMPDDGSMLGVGDMPGGMMSGGSSMMGGSASGGYYRSGGMTSSGSGVSGFSSSITPYTEMYRGDIGGGSGMSSMLMPGGYSYSRVYRSAPTRSIYTIYRTSRYPTTPYVF